MKVIKKSFCVLFLIVCTVFSVSPAFADTSYPMNNRVPIEGISCTASGYGTTTLDLPYKTISIVVRETNQFFTAEEMTAIKANPQEHMYDLKNTYINGSVLYDGTTKFYVEKLPIVAIRASQSGSLVLEIYMKDLLNYQVPKDGHGTITSECDFTNHTKYTLPYGFTVHSETLSGGVLPEGSVVLSPDNFEYLNRWVKLTGNFGGETYTILKQSDATNTDGPVVFFTAKEGGEYSVCIQAYAYTDTRKTSINLDGVKMDFSAVADADGVWTWTGEDSGRTVILKQGETYSLQLSKSSDRYARCGVIALIPASETSDFLEDAAAESGIISYSDAAIIQKATTDTFVPDVKTVNVTVNDVSVEGVSAGVAAKNNYPVRIFGNYLENPTILDALVASGQFPNTQTNVADGMFNNMQVSLNDKKIVNLDIVPVREGDIITTVSSAVDKTNFAPVSLADVYKTDGNTGTIGSNQYIETDSNGNKTTLPKDHNLVSSSPKICLTSSVLESKIGAFAKETTQNGLIGCYLSGYMLKTTDNNGTPAGSKVYFENVPIQAYQSTVSASTPTVPARLDIVVAGGMKAVAKNSSDIVLSDNGVSVHAPYTYPIQSTANYDWSNIYITNSSVENGLKIYHVADNTYVVTTDGMQSAKVFNITYDQDGRTVKSVTSTDETFLCTEPVTYKLNDNQKVLIWNNTPFNGDAANAGTAMKPLCEALVPVAY